MPDLETLRLLLALVQQCESNGWEKTNKGEDAHGDARCHLSLSLYELDVADSQDPLRKEIREYFGSRGVPDFSVDELDPAWAHRRAYVPLDSEEEPYEDE